MTWAWPLVSAGWVLVPAFGWWTGAHPRPTFVGWWVLWSVVVCAVGMRQPVRRVVPEAAWLLGTVVAVTFVHAFTGPSFTIAWCYQASLILLAAWILAERAAFAWLRTAVQIAAVGQVLVVGYDLAAYWLPWPVDPWPADGLGITGTLHHRAALGVWWAVASLWTTGTAAWGWAGLSAVTGSWTGAFLALLRLVVERLRRAGWLPALWPIAGLSLLLLTHRWWLPKLLVRFDEYESLRVIADGWITGWGFRPFPGGFVETDRLGVASIRLDYHSVWIEWIARTGLIGTVGLVGLWRGIFRRLTAPWRWTAALAIWTGLWQSGEANPALLLLFLVWLIGLSEEVSRARPSV